MLDLSVDEDFVVLRDGQRGRQFCVVVDRVADDDHPLLPYPATGSTDGAIVRPAPPGDPLPATTGRAAPLIAYLATDVGLPRRQLVAIPLGPDGWRGAVRGARRRDDAELEGLDADDAGRRLLLVWNVAGGRSELELLDTWTGRADGRRRPARARSSTGAAAEPRRATALMAVEGPERPRELWRLDAATRTWSRVTADPAAADRAAGRARRSSSCTGATGCR